MDGVSTNLIRAIQSIYNKCESKVKLREQDTDWFAVKTGVRQEVISPLLFIRFLDRCMKEINENHDRHTFTYADDVAVICSTECELQEAVDRWDIVKNEKGMKINVNKTAVMNISRENKQLNRSIGNERLTQVTNLDDLGVQMNEESYKQDIEIDNRINKFNKNLGAIYPLIKDRNIPAKCKTIIYDTILRPILIYGSEAWSLTTQNPNQE